MLQIRIESDGIVFGYTRKNKRSYKSLNYHRRLVKPGKTQWSQTITRETESSYFDESDYESWCSEEGHHWWISKDAAVRIGNRGERIAFFPCCENHPGPWHGYPVSAIEDHNYEVPEELVSQWQDGGTIDDLAAARLRRGKL